MFYVDEGKIFDTLILNSQTEAHYNRVFFASTIDVDNIFVEPVECVGRCCMRVEYFDVSLDETTKHKSWGPPSYLVDNNVDTKYVLTG
jgi:hypothetical protein